MAPGRGVTGEAAHPGGVPMALVSVGHRLVAGPEARGVAGGAHGVGVEGATTPVERVAGPGALVGFQLKPALAALGSGAGIPGNVEGLEPPPRQGQQVLLEWIHAQGVAHREIRRLAIGPFGTDQVVFTASEKTHPAATLHEPDIIKVPQHISGSGGLLGPGMVGRFPGRRSCRVTAQARRVICCGPRKHRHQRHQPRNPDPQPAAPAHCTAPGRGFRAGASAAVTDTTG